MGAWIEILIKMGRIFLFLSLPSWERGLKFLSAAIQVHKELVAPLVGAWIEISYFVRRQSNRCVAPLVGAWIEIAQKWHGF